MYKKRSTAHRERTGEIAKRQNKFVDRVDKGAYIAAVVGKERVGRRKIIVKA